MQTFRDYINMVEQVGAAQTPTRTPISQKSQGKWKASKQEIIEYWKSLAPNTPIFMTPISYDHKGSTYAEDGVRITGSPQFIASVLGRLKDFLAFESPATKLNLVYRQTSSSTFDPEKLNKTFVCYIQSRQRHR